MTIDAAVEREERKTLEGLVVSARMSKTRIVRVRRVFRHAFYDKVVQRSKKLYAHDEENASREGDRVEIMSTRPISKTKRWRVVRVLPAVGSPARASGRAGAGK